MTTYPHLRELCVTAACLVNSWTIYGTTVQAYSSQDCVYLAHGFNILVSNIAVGLTEEQEKDRVRGPGVWSTEKPARPTYPNSCISLLDVVSSGDSQGSSRGSSRPGWAGWAKSL